MEVSKLQSCNKQSFGNLYLSKKLVQKIADEATHIRFLVELSNIRNNISQNKLDKKKFVDVILNENNDGFFAIISSKKQGIPHNPAAEHVIEPTKDGFAKLKKWVNDWNHAYNPRTIEHSKKFDELIRSANWENTPLDKALKALWG